MSRGKAKRPAAEAAQLPIGQLVDAQRQQLFRAMSVLHVARLALTSKSEGFDPDQCDTALQLVHSIVDDVAAALERQGGPS